MVVAWICEKKGNDPYTTAAFKENVSENCFAEEGGKKWNKCFNDRLHKAATEKRGWHEADPAPLLPALAAALQEKIDALTSD